MLVVGAWVIDPQIVRAPVAAIPADVSNTEALGRVLYTHYVYFFQAAGLVLLVAMIGAIVLTLRHASGRQAPGRRRAERPHQGKRRWRSSKVPSRAGVPEELA